MIIHISWTGPIEIDHIKNYNDRDIDYGLYQIYGSHPIYGTDVLLYIGKAEQQTFSERIKREDWDKNNDKIYIGRLIGNENMIIMNEWNKKIEIAEKLLIYSHSPAMNAANIGSMPENFLNDIIIYNWGVHRQIFPVVSGDRWSKKFDNIPIEEYYSMKKAK